MNLKQTATITVVGGALAAWIVSAGTSDVRVSPRVVRKTTPAEKSGAELASEIARLHERLRPTATPRSDGRNLFEFNASRSAPAPARSAAPPTEDAPPIAPPPPSFKLSGIAEDSSPAGPIRTAIITGQGELFLVKEGEMLATRYRVVKISVDVVELLDVETNETRRLAMQ